MELAFYAPLKSPDFPVPSGDREIARRLLQGLDLAGTDVSLVSRFRSYEGRGDRSRQQAIRGAGRRQAAALAARLMALPAARRPRLWFTYHLYHKAPDWLGPAVAGRLRIPYVVAEASVAAKQASGPWRDGYQACIPALRQAAVVLALNSQDVPGLESVLGTDVTIRRLAPFLDTTQFAPVPDARHKGCARAASSFRNSLRARWSATLGINPGSTWVLTVAMMRPGNKLSSFEVLSRALARLPDPRWHLLVAGDGDARPGVEAALAKLPAGQVSLLGCRGRDEIVSLMQAADLFAWPAVDEPLGMAMLEAQACGLPVVTARVRGVGDIVEHGVTGLMGREGDDQGFAEQLQRLRSDDLLRTMLARQARQRAVDRHSLVAAARRLRSIILPLMEPPA